MVGSTFGLMNLTDFAFFAGLLILSVLYRYIPKRKFSQITKGVMSGIVVCVFMFSQYLNSHVVKAWNPEVYGDLNLWEVTVKRIDEDLCSNSSDLQANGPLIHSVRAAADLKRVMSVRRELTEFDRNRVERFIADSPDFEELPDSLIQANRAKNVILVVVESLNALALNDSLRGLPVAPVLRGLIESEGTLSALNVVSQVREGGSGDGHLMINTGLHPLEHYSTSLILGSTNWYPGLPKILATHDSQALFADDGSIWNQIDSFRNFGFSRVLTSDSIPGDLANSMGKDGAMFNCASKITKELRRPFFMELVTMSMHMPFNDSYIPDSQLALLSRDELSSADIRSKYLAMVNYFDTELGAFISRLKDEGLFENTVIIIVSDHSVRMNFEEKGDLPPMAFIAVNCGVTMSIQQIVGEIDVYSTILNLFGLTGPQGWHGVGRSIIDPQLKAAYGPAGTVIGDADSLEARRLKDAFEISDLILRTDYFAQ